MKTKNKGRCMKTRAKIMIAIGAATVTGGIVTPVIVSRLKSQGEAKIPPNMRALKHFARSAEANYSESDISMFRSQIERSYNTHVAKLGNEIAEEDLQKKLDEAASQSNDEQPQDAVNRLRNVAAELHVSLMDWVQLSETKDEYLNDVLNNMDPDNLLNNAQKEDIRSSLAHTIDQGIANNQTYDEFESAFSAVTIGINSKIDQRSKNNQKLANFLSATASTQEVNDSVIKTKNALNDSVSQDKILPYQELSEFELPAIVKDSYLNTLKPMFGGMKTAVPEYNTIVKNQNSATDNVFLQVGDKLSATANYDNSWLSSLFFGWKDGTKTGLAPKSSAQFDAQKSKNDKMLDIKSLTNITAAGDYIDGTINNIDYDYENNPYIVNIEIEWLLHAQDVSDDDLSTATSIQTYTFKLPKPLRMWLEAKQINDNVDILSKFQSNRADDNMLWQDFLGGLYTNGNKGVDMNIDSSDGLPVYSANDDIIGTDISFGQLLSMSNLGNMIDQLDLPGIDIHMTIIGYSGNNGSNVLYVDYGFINTDNDDYILTGKNELWAANRELEAHDDMSYNENVAEKLNATEILKKLNISDQFDKKQAQINLKATPKEKYTMITDFYEGTYNELNIAASLMMDTVKDNNGKEVTFDDAYMMIWVDKAVQIANDVIQIAAIGVSMGVEFAIIAATVGTNVSGWINVGILSALEIFSGVALASKIVDITTVKFAYGDAVSSTVTANMGIQQGIGDKEWNDIKVGADQYKSLDYKNSKDMARIQELYDEIWHIQYDEHDNAQIRINKFMNDNVETIDNDLDITLMLSIFSGMTYASYGIHAFAHFSYLTTLYSFIKMTKSVNLAGYVIKIAGRDVKWDFLIRDLAENHEITLLEEPLIFKGTPLAMSGEIPQNWSKEQWINHFESKIEEFKNITREHPYDSGLAGWWREGSPFIPEEAVPGHQTWAIRTNKNKSNFGTWGEYVDSFNIADTESTLNDIRKFDTSLNSGVISDQAGTELSAMVKGRFADYNIETTRMAAAKGLSGAAIIIDGIVTAFALLMQLATSLVTELYLAPIIQRFFNHFKV